ncbi:MAG: diaminopimelate decarboxylase [Candidatus Saganbacteria bacterium]|nr:diaminopimelate decarboxylase [Candidatus Saganbacteria bacterium]
MNSKVAPVTTEINKKGNLEIGGCDTISLAEKFGTPLYVMDEKTLVENCRNYTEPLKKIYPKHLVIFANKAMCVTGILKIIKKEELGADVVSGGELFNTLAAGINKEKIYFHGNNKSPQELKEALENKIGRIVVDNLDELKRLDALTKKQKKTAKILLRVNPGIEAHTHEFVQTGKVNSKFGIAKEQILHVVKLIEHMSGLDFVGLHAHIGSQILGLDSYYAEIGVLTDLAIQIKKETGKTCGEINIGGGLGIAYLEEYPLFDIKDAVAKIAQYFKDTVKNKGLGEPLLILEPGRSIVGRAGVTLYTVGVVKDIPAVEKYVVVDGGMGDNPRQILYSAKYETTIANKASHKKEETVTVAGRYCESGDVLIKDSKLQPAEVGDTLAIFATGAYNYSMAMNYNQVPKPAVVLVKSGKVKLIVKRQTYKDLVRNEL